MDGFNNDNVETVENVETVDSNTGSYSETTAYDTTYASEPNANGSKVFAIISLVCGILAILCMCCGWFGIILGVAAVVLGILSIKKEEDAKGMAIAGIVCGGIGLIVAIIVLVTAGALSSMDPDAITDYVEQLENSL